MKRMRTLFFAVTAISIFGWLMSVMDVSSPRHELRSMKILKDRKKWDANVTVEMSQLCQFPQPNPWDESILQFVYDTPPIRCRSVQPKLAFIDSNNMLRINESQLHISGYSISAISCFYYEINRPVGQDDQINFGQQKLLPIQTGVKIDVDVISVKCTNWLGISIYNDILIYPRRLIPKIRRTVERPLSVLAFAVDSMSRLNFMRQLPQTYEYLTRRMGAVVLHGMTRVGDNTYPNIMATLTGQITDYGPLERPKLGIYFDSWPLVWKHFSERGYTTLYAEDELEYAIFNYASSGFLRPPTDHYLRPFYIALQDHSSFKLSSHLCYGSKPKHVTQMQYLTDFLTDPQKRPYFAFSLLTELSHNLLNQIGVADGDFEEFLRHLYEDGHLDDTVVFFFGDHGNRFDEIRLTPIGRIENNMPFFAVYLPDRLKKQFPDIFQTLKINSARLTSMLDIHETYIDIWRFSTLGTQLGADFKHISPHGLTLFAPIPTNRTCLIAGIKDQYCMCSPEKELKLDDERTLKAGKAVVDTINSLTKDFRNLCAKLRLHSILKSHRLTPEPEVSSDKIRVVIEVKPGNGIFEGIATFTEQKINVNTDISRINRYKGQDGCITTEMKANLIDLRNFCYCL